MRLTRWKRTQERASIRPTRWLRSPESPTKLPATGSTLMCPHTGATYVISDMETANARETGVARIVDGIASRGGLGLASIQEVVNAIDFLMTASENQFLMDYLQWRMANPIVK